MYKIIIEIGNLVNRWKNNDFNEENKKESGDEEEGEEMGAVNMKVRGQYTKLRNTKNEKGNSKKKSLKKIC